MEKYLGQLISIKFEDKKLISRGFLIDYSSDWILLKSNPVDYVIDGYVILRNKNIKSVSRDEDNIFTEKVILLKGLKIDNKNIIPLSDLTSILTFLNDKYEVFQLATKREKAVYLGKLIEISEEELTIDFLETRGDFGGEMSFNPTKIRVIEFDTDYINSLKLVNRLSKE